MWRFTITEKDPRASSWLKVPTSNFTFKTLLRHFTKLALGIVKSLRYLREPSFEALIQTEWLWNGFIIYFLGWNNRISIPLSSFLKQFNILMCLERETHLCIGILTSMTNAGCAHSRLTMWPPQPASRALQTSRHALASLLWCRWIVGTLCTFQMNVVVFLLIHIFSVLRLCWCWCRPGWAGPGVCCSPLRQFSRAQLAEFRFCCGCGARPQ